VGVEGDVAAIVRAKASKAVGSGRTGVEGDLTVRRLDAFGVGGSKSGRGSLEFFC
jgi:hypothetical protein